MSASTVHGQGAPGKHRGRAIAGPAAAQRPGNHQIDIVDAGGSLVVTYGGASHRVPLERAGMSLGRHATPFPPTALVGPRLGAAPFVDHAGIYAELLGWCHRDEPCGLSVLTGAGGAGKTRMAIRLCQESERWHWLAGVLCPGAEVTALEELARVPTALLVVMENAETRGVELATLMTLLADHVRSGYPARVLLTVRDRPIRDHWLQSLRGASAEIDLWLGRATMHRLADHPPSTSVRRELYVGAYRTFAAHLGASGQYIEAPAALESAVFSNPLMIVIGAFLGVHGEALPSSEPDLVERLIENHEDRYWCHVAADHEAHLRPGKMLRRQVAALSVLAGADDEAEASRLLSLIDEGMVTSGGGQLQLARWAAKLYPGPRYWNRFQPEVVAEHLVASTFGDDEAVLSGVLCDRRAASLADAVGLLARAAVGRGALTAAMRGVLDQRLAYMCDQAGAVAQVAPGAALGAALTDLVQVCPPDPAGLPAILDELPAHLDFGLASMAAVLTQRTELYYRRLAENDSEAHLPKWAVALNNLSVRLSDVGRLDEAAAAVSEAVGLYRRLAQVDGDIYEPNLAIALRNLSLRLADVGRRDEAAAAVSEAVALYRRLAHAGGEVYQPSLAIALRNLSLRLTQVGRLDEAAAAAGEAVQLYRQLDQSAADGRRPRLAASLGDFSLRLAEAGRREEAAAAIAESMALYRELVASDRERYLPRLAASLGDLSLRLAEAGRRDDAAAANSEAVGLYRGLAEVNGTRYLPTLAASLVDFSRRLADVGRKEKARAAITEAVGHYRHLAGADPMYRPQLAESLEVLSVRLSDIGLRKEAAARRAEAQELMQPYRRPQRSQPLFASRGAPAPLRR